MISRHVILLSTSVLLICKLSEANSDKHFLTLSADCGEDGRTANLTLHTSEPFFGLLYSRDHASTCKTVGEGLTATQLVIDHEKKCGLELMEKRQRNLLVAAASDQVNVNFALEFPLEESMLLLVKSRWIIRVPIFCYTKVK